MKRILLLLNLSFLLLSCSVTSTTLKVEPSNDSNTLVIGSISLDAKNFKMYGYATVNGHHTKNIKLTFANLTNGEKFEVKSYDKSGLFYFSANEESRYQLVKIYFKVTRSNDSWADVWTNPSDIMFDTSREGVYNIGLLTWEADKKMDFYEVTPTKEFYRVKELVFEEYPDSLWLQNNWIDTEMLNQ